MALAFLFDENVRVRLASAVRRHNARGREPIDTIDVGDPAGPPLGVRDPELVSWAEREGRILVSFDHGTLPDVLAAHLDAGGHSPGVFLIRPRRALVEVVEFLALAAHYSDAWEWRDRHVYIPQD